MLTAAVAVAQQPQPLPGPACPGDMVRNGGFYDRLVAGDLGYNGSVAGWSVLTQTPQVVATDGALAPGCLLMWGNQTVGESAKQQVGGSGFTYGITYEISFSYRWINNNPALPPHVSFRLCNATSEPSSYPPTDANCSLLCITPVTASTSWVRYTTAAYSLATGSWLTINPENEFAVNDGNYVSWGEIDDICIRPVAVCPNNVLVNGNFTAGLVPGDLGINGSVTGWSALTNTPQVLTTGSNSAGCIQMWGNQVVGESIMQQCTFLANHTYRVAFSYAWVDNNNPVLPQYVHFTLRAAATLPSLYPGLTSPTTNPVIASSLDHNATWFKVYSALWTPTVNYSWITINPENDSNQNNGNFVSWGQIDDICIQDVTFPAVPSPFGNGCSGLQLDAAPGPVLGNVANLVTSNLPGGSLVGAQILGFGQYPLGIDLTGLGMPGCFQYVTPDSVQFFLTAGPTATSILSIPNDLSYLGVVINGQSLMFAPGINPLGAVSSNGLHLTIGDY
jgi:hypothetical protein